MIPYADHGDHDDHLDHYDHLEHNDHLDNDDHLDHDDHLNHDDHLVSDDYHITMMTLVTKTQRKQRDNMRTGKENSVEILKWLLICSQDLRGFVRKVR